MNQVLEILKLTNPDWAPIFKAWEDINHAELDDVQDQEVEEVLGEITDQEQAKEADQITVNQQLLEQLNHELELKSTLAYALGACETCFGLEPECEVCQGNGTPGYYSPELDLFNQWILPAVRRIKRKNRIKF